MSKFVDTLKAYWGYDSFRPLQEKIIQSITDGKDTLGLMPTGGGKSLTFQVPTMQMEGICLVITPLIALMKDQVDNLKQKGIKATAVYSGMGRQEIITNLENCIFGNYKFLYISPERLNTDLFRNKLQYMNVCMIAIDESHCISQWGYDFRPSYLRIAEIRTLLPDIPLLALTATATAEVIEDIQEKLGFKEKNVFRKSFERKNIAYIVRKTEDKLSEIINILQKVKGTGIVYVRSRKRTKELAKELSDQGINADHFHAGLNPEEKILKQNNWKTGKTRIMVCTNAFGMGIDKPDVRVVIHYEMPSSLEEYFQEAGRAGRDEEKAFAVALCSERDNARLKKRIVDEFPDREIIKDIYEKLAFYFQLGVDSGCHTTYNFDLEQFCTNFKFSFTLVHHALRILQLSEYIEYVEEPDKQSKLIFIAERDELYRYSDFNQETELLMQILLRSYTGLFADYVYIDEKLLSLRTGLSHHQVYEILKMLSSQQIIHYIPAKKTPIITYLRNREDKKYLVIPRSVYEDRKDKLETRIQSIIEYTTSENECRSRILLKYFGEKRTEDCGHCDVCLAKRDDGLNNYTFNKIAKEIMELIENESTLKIESLFERFTFPQKHVITVIRHLSEEEKLRIDKNLILKTEK